MGGASCPLAWSGDEWREGTESISEMLFLGAEFHLVPLYCRSTGAIAMIKADLSDVYYSMNFGERRFGKYGRL
jgi:hypothetical protein